MNSNIVIDDGLKDYTFSNKKGEVFGSFSFNPSDTGILERYKKVVDFFNAYKVDESSDEAVEKAISQLNADLMEQINFLLNRNVSEDLFKVYVPCAVFANGDFYAETVIETIGKIIEEEMGVRLKKKMKRISKYTQKYHK